MFLVFDLPLFFVGIGFHLVVMDSNRFALALSQVSYWFFHEAGSCKFPRLIVCFCRSKTGFSCTDCSGEMESSLLCEALSCFHKWWWIALLGVSLWTWQLLLESNRFGGAVELIFGRFVRDVWVVFSQGETHVSNLLENPIKHKQNFQKPIDTDNNLLKSFKRQ